MNESITNAVDTGKTNTYHKKPVKWAFQKKPLSQATCDILGETESQLRWAFSINFPSANLHLN